jgi:hypothetical protein
MENCFQTIYHPSFMVHWWVLVHCGQAQSVLLPGAHRYASVVAEEQRT